MVKEALEKFKIRKEEFRKKTKKEEKQWNFSENKLKIQVIQEQKKYLQKWKERKQTNF